MTKSKKIRLLTEYQEKGLGEQIVLIIKDKWDFDPEVIPHNYEVREKYCVNDAINQFKEQKGYIFDNVTIKDLQKIIEHNKPLGISKEYEDTKGLFFSMYPDYVKQRKETFNRMMGMYNKYKSQFVGL